MKRRVTLGELANDGVLVIGDGYRTKRAEHGRPGFRILRVADVDGGALRLDSPDFVSTSMRRQIGAKLSQKGDVLLTTKGTVGRVAVVPDLEQPVVYSPQLCFFRVRNRDVLERLWLAYWFQSSAFNRQASHRANNTDMAAYINLADIRSLTLDLPWVAEQRAIAEVLGALDEKIAANTLLIAAANDLRAMRFQAMLGPDQARLSDLAQFVNGRAFTNGASGNGRVVIRIAELNSGIGGSTVYNNIEVPEDHLARPGDLLFAWSGSLTVHRWFRREGIINQHIFKVIPAPGIPMWVVEGALQERLSEFRSIAADKATTMGHIQRRHLDARVSVPSPQSVTNEHALMQALWDRALAAELETVVLTSTRDELLPLLMSGKVRVKDAERVVEGVV